MSEEGSGDKAIVDEPPPPPPKRFTFTLIELMIVITIIGTLAAISTPKFKAARPRANTRACFANQKTLAGALEMYFVDNKIEVRPPALEPSLLSALHSGGYLQSIPTDPGEGADSSGNYVFATGGNGIRCRVHGPIP